MLPRSCQQIHKLAEDIDFILIETIRKNEFHNKSRPFQEGFPGKVPQRGKEWQYVCQLTFPHQKQ